MGLHIHGKYVYSTLALEEEREIVKEETALRKEVCCYVHVDVYTLQGCIHVHVARYIHDFLCIWVGILARYMG